MKENAQPPGVGFTLKAEGMCDVITYGRGVSSGGFQAPWPLSRSRNPYRPSSMLVRAIGTLVVADDAGESGECGLSFLGGFQADEMEADRASTVYRGFLVA